MEKQLYYVNLNPNSMNIHSLQLNDGQIEYGISATKKELFPLEKLIDS